MMVEKGKTPNLSDDNNAKKRETFPLKVSIPAMTTVPMPSSTSAASGDPQNPSHVNPPSTRDSRQPLTSPPHTTVTSSSTAAYTSTVQALPFVGGKTPNPPPQMAPKIIQDPSSLPPSQPQGILYPVASSGRGFIPKSFRPQSPDQLVTIANPGGGGFPPRSLLAFSNQVQVRPFVFPPADPLAHSVHLMRPPHLQPSSQIGSRQMGAAVPGTIKSVPAVLHPKVSPFSSSTPDFNSYKELRERGRDDTVVTIHDRKVRLSDGASLYALSRSWVRNGLPQESQPLFGEGVKLLPRPLPVTAVDTLPKKGEADDEEEEKEEDAGSVEQLSPQELLQRHIKRAKRVRARLREERLRRIARYKQRLALLLPPPVEQFRNDATPGS